MVKMSDILEKKGRSLQPPDLRRSDAKAAPPPPEAPEAPSQRPYKGPDGAGFPRRPGPAAPQSPSSGREQKAGQTTGITQAQIDRQAPPQKGDGKATFIKKRVPVKKDDLAPPPPPITAEDESDKERLVSLYSPYSPQGKRIDILRTQVLYPFHGDPPRTIMITSAAPREGRSLLTSNLAISFARGLQQYVMVMDCHLFDPAIHRLLEVPRVPGLSDFLERDATVPQIIHWTSVDKLSVIPAGSPSERSAEILATDKMATLVQELQARYKDRYILLDTPPVQVFDDPAVLARMVEGIIFVVGAGDTDRELVLRGIRSLPEEKIMGVVLNDSRGTVIDAPDLKVGMERVSG